MGAISDLHQIEFNLVTAIVQPVFCREHSMELSEIGGTPRKINMRFPQLAVGTAETAVVGAQGLLHRASPNPSPRWNGEAF